MDLRRANPEENDKRRMLAAAVVESVLNAGLPAQSYEEAGDHLTGAVVEVDPFEASEGGGVYVTWNVHQRLVEEFQGPLLAEEFDHPAIRLHGAVLEAMTCALETILIASGFSVGRPEDEYRADSVQVFAGSH